MPLDKDTLAHFVKASVDAQQNLWDTMRDLESFVGRDLDSLPEWVELALGFTPSTEQELVDSFISTFELEGEVA